MRSDSGNAGAAQNTPVRRPGAARSSVKEAAPPTTRRFESSHARPASRLPDRPAGV